MAHWVGAGRYLPDEHKHFAIWFSYGHASWSYVNKVTQFIIIWAAWFSFVLDAPSSLLSLHCHFAHLHAWTGAHCLSLCAAIVTSDKSKDCTTFKWKAVSPYKATAFCRKFSPLVYASWERVAHIRWAAPAKGVKGVSRIEVQRTRVVQRWTLDSIAYNCWASPHHTKVRQIVKTLRCRRLIETTLKHKQNCNIKNAEPRSLYRIAKKHLYKA